MKHIYLSREVDFDPKGFSNPVSTLTGLGAVQARKNAHRIGVELRREGIHDISVVASRCDYALLTAHELASGLRAEGIATRPPYTLSTLGAQYGLPSQAVKDIIATADDAVLIVAHGRTIDAFLREVHFWGQPGWRIPMPDVGEYHAFKISEDFPVHRSDFLPLREYVRRTMKKGLD